MSEAGTAAEGHRPRRRLTFGLVTQAGAVLTLVSTGLGIYFAIRDDGGSKPAPGAMAAEVTALDVEPGSFGDYLVQKNVAAGAVTPALLRRTGAILTVKWTAKGLAHRDLPLRWELVDAASGAHAGDEQARTLRPDRDSDGGGLLLWAPVPQDGHRYRAIVTIYRPGQRTAISFLDRRSSPAFTAAAAR